MTSPLKRQPSMLPAPVIHKRKKAMQSKNLQYTMPDENAKGAKNSGVIGQYPYFAPDTVGMKKAPKMTKADELYLKKFMQGRQMEADANIEKWEKDHAAPPGDPFGDDDDENQKVNINTRLFEERRRQLAKGLKRFEPPDKTTLTNEIFGEHKYFQQEVDTKNNEEM